MNHRGRRVVCLLALLTAAGAAQNASAAGKRAGRRSASAPNAGPNTEARSESAQQQPADENGNVTEAEVDEAYGPVPTSYSVKEGDTLWDICRNVFGDPWMWPRIWALNPQVTNPHWIFPGDVLALSNAPVPTPVTLPPQPGLSTLEVLPAAPPGTRVREMGFVSSDELKQAGKIEGSAEEKIMLVTGDVAYASVSTDKPLQAGQRYTNYVVDWKSPVKDPKTGKLYGYLVKISGDLDVAQADKGEMARGMLVNLREPVERGYMVGPLYHQFRRVPSRAADKSLRAQVVAALQPNWLVASEMFVVLNVGRATGVQVGNRFFVVRRGDGYGTVLGGWNVQDERFPSETIAELMVVHVQDAVAIAWVVGGKREIAVGEFAESRQGT